MKVLITDDRENDFHITRGWVKRAVPEMPTAVLSAFKVPGQMNNGILEFIFKHTTRPGDRVLDPMASVGTAIHFGMRMKRRVEGIELIPNLVRIGQCRLKKSLGERGAAALRQGNILEVKLPADTYRLILFSPPQLRIKRGPYPAQKDQMGNFNLISEKKYWEKTRRIVRKLKNALMPKGTLVTLNVTMKRPDGTLYHFPNCMNAALEASGLVLRDEYIVQRLHHKNIDHISYEYLRLYGRC